MEVKINLNKQIELLERTKKALEELNKCIEEINKDYVLKNKINVTVDVNTEIEEPPSPPEPTENSSTTVFIKDKLD